MTSQEGTRHLPGDNKERKTGPAFTETLKRQFREVMEAVTQRPPAPQPKSKRRKEDARGLFKRVCTILHTPETRRALFRLAEKILHRAPLLSAAPAPASLSTHHAGVDFTPWDIPPDHDEHAEYLRLLETSEQEDFNSQHDRSSADDMQQQTDFDYPAHDTLSLHL